MPQTENSTSPSGLAGLARTSHLGSECRDTAKAGGLADLWPTRGSVVVSSMASDSHSWNLVYLELLVEELGFQVLNLGACVPDELLVEQVEALRPDMVVISSVNGHGYYDGLRVIGKLRAAASGSRIPVVIGGKLGIDGNDDHRSHNLLAAGFDAVFDDSGTSPASLVSFIARRLGPC